MEKVKGIGGVFFKTQDSKRLREWYAQHLGLETESWGTAFHWRDSEDPTRKNFTVLGLFKNDTDYFGPGPLDHMLNFIVEDLEAFRRQLSDSGLEVSDTVEDENGRFAWVTDPDGRRIELWQPPAQGDGE
ncbi:MAG: VOC family protein [Rubrivivax sp.]|nr:VOC family protein [Pyrinomonadaceae bacterium]